MSCCFFSGKIDFWYGEEKFRQNIHVLDCLKIEFKGFDDVKHVIKLQIYYFFNDVDWNLRDAAWLA